MSETMLVLSRSGNQARQLGQYAIDFVRGRFAPPAPAVLLRLEQFHLDSVACGVAALAIAANAPRVLRAEALAYPCPAPLGVKCFASRCTVQAEKAVLAGCAAVRELDANGTNFGYNPQRNQTQGEFGHNDFYPVAIAAAQQAGADGATAVRAMLCLDEIRGRLAEAFSLKSHKLDHVLHGGIASAAVYGAVLGATAEQIESAIGLLVSHYVPFRAIRHGEQLSDSKGASAALTAECAVLSVRRAMRGFVGPADIFRNPQAVFSLFGRSPSGESPFDLAVATSGADFAVMGMHFKLGMYEHQSAGAIQAICDLLARQRGLAADAEQIRRVRIAIYEPAYSIISDPHKRDPRTRQSADHSLVYIAARVLRKAIVSHARSWEDLMLMPADYADEALFDPPTRRLMEWIEVVHGGASYDALYPDGIPTSLTIEHAVLGTVESGLVRYPLGHARGPQEHLAEMLRLKFERFAGLGVDDPAGLRRRLSGLAERRAEEVAELYDFEVRGCEG